SGTRRPAARTSACPRRSWPSSRGETLLRSPAIRISISTPSLRSTHARRGERASRRRRPSCHTVLVDDEELLAQAEEALTEIKVAKGLSDRQASVLAALRIRLKGSSGKSLEEMLEATGGLQPGPAGSAPGERGGAAAPQKPDRLEQELAKAEGEPKQSLDDLLSKPKPKPEGPSWRHPRGGDLPGGMRVRRP